MSGPACRVGALGHRATPHISLVAWASASASSVAAPSHAVAGSGRLGVRHKFMFLLGARSYSPLHSQRVGHSGPAPTHRSPPLLFSARPLSPMMPSALVGGSTNDRQRRAHGDAISRFRYGKRCSRHTCLPVMLLVASGCVDPTGIAGGSRSFEPAPRQTCCIPVI